MVVVGRQWMDRWVVVGGGKYSIWGWLLVHGRWLVLVVGGDIFIHDTLPVAGGCKASGLNKC